MKRKKASKSERRELQEMINKIYPYCWICGKKIESKHHVPPKCTSPKMMIKIPVCKRHHKMLNSGMDYTAKEKRSLRSNLRKIEKGIKNIRKKLLGKES